jgi:hypothetical protein
MKRIITILSAMALAVGLFAGSALALQEGDFIGKGEVQTFFGWNNAQLQANADKLLVTATTTTEWTCSGINNGGNEVIQERSTETVTSATIVGRDDRGRQITGFYVGAPGVPVVEGPAVGSCSNASWGPTYDGNAEAGDTVYSFDLAN